ncbi:MAG: hypothetical protein M1826_007215 [Phylliscum demangeonii]|nr:MAG: hypothetical protein M1826_007215 [Phylliscum demangeonii]
MYTSTLPPPSSLRQLLLVSLLLLFLPFLASLSSATPLAAQIQAQGPALTPHSRFSTGTQRLSLTPGPHAHTQAHAQAEAPEYRDRLAGDSIARCERRCVEAHTVRWYRQPPELPNQPSGLLACLRTCPMKATREDDYDHLPVRWPYAMEDAIQNAVDHNYTACIIRGIRQGLPNPDHDPCQSEAMWGDFTPQHTVANLRDFRRELLKEYRKKAAEESGPIIKQVLTEILKAILKKRDE